LPLLQPPRTRKDRALQLCKQLGRFVAAHWSKGAVLAVLITIIVLVAVKVGEVAQEHWTNVHAA
jgi:hypothetical protein